jgi:hypothetical protein
MECKKMPIFYRISFNSNCFTDYSHVPPYRNSEGIRKSMAVRKARENNRRIMISQVEYPASASALVLKYICFAVVHFFCGCAFVLQVYNFFVVVK